MSKLIIYVREIGLFLLKHENEKDVSFISANDEHGVITNGWLRVSHRKLDHEKSKPYRPYHTHDEKQLLKENEKVQLDVEVWPTIGYCSKRISFSILCWRKRFFIY